MTTETFWCEHAWLDDGVADSVLVGVSEGRITAMRVLEGSGDPKRNAELKKRLEGEADG